VCHCAGLSLLERLKKSYVYVEYLNLKEQFENEMIKNSDEGDEQHEVGVLNGQNAVGLQFFEDNKMTGSLLSGYKMTLQVLQISGNIGTLPISLYCHDLISGGILRVYAFARGKTKLKSKDYAQIGSVFEISNFKMGLANHDFLHNQYKCPYEMNASMCNIQKSTNAGFDNLRMNDAIQLRPMTPIYGSMLFIVNEINEIVNANEYTVQSLQVSDVDGEIGMIEVWDPAKYPVLLEIYNLLEVAEDKACVYVRLMKPSSVKIYEDILRCTCILSKGSMLNIVDSKEAAEMFEKYSNYPSMTYT
jgi:hypothetical protein